MKWITLERPSLTALASAWLITRFIDQGAQIIFTPEADFDRVFRETSGIPFEVPGVEFSSGSTQTAFSILLTSYRFTNQALRQMNRLLGATDPKVLQETFNRAGLEDEWASLSKPSSTDEIALTQAISAFDALYRTLIPEPAGSESGSGTS